MRLSHELNTKLRFFFFAFIAVALGVSISVLQYRKTFQNRAEEISTQNGFEKPADVPISAQGELLIKVKADAGVSTSNTDEIIENKEVPVEQLNKESLPPAIQEISEEKEVEAIQKIVDNETQKN
jgi:hypothetical protein